jgi:hypothetical protein
MALISAFVIDEVAEDALQNGQSKVVMPLRDEDAECRHADRAEDAIGYKTHWWEFVSLAYFNTLPAIKYGTWRGNGSGLSFQDLIVIQRM